MLQTLASVKADDIQFVVVHYCPNCEAPRVMGLNKIRTAIFGRQDVLTFKCETCGTELIDRISSTSVDLIKGPYNVTDEEWLSHCRFALATEPQRGIGT
ncbi:hypothetical protein [Rhodopseudomonas sp. BAL398]|uniref:hypothetical protein n=1 Tax=Rhodopseudomonas sp. BAL398 TaxID=3034676 RepID=UPI000AEE1EDE|nr:hypothetical protein [Rhodopseudomonas sp. BAL398]